MSPLLFSLLLLCLFCSLATATARPLPLPLAKPQPSAAAATARWLASQNSWGVLSTISSDLGGSPFGNVVSYSDGLPGEGSGVPYFYLTTLDPTARDALLDQRSSFTLSEFPLGTCGTIDPENPTCSKLTLSGKDPNPLKRKVDPAFLIGVGRLLHRSQSTSVFATPISKYFNVSQPSDQEKSGLLF